MDTARELPKKMKAIVAYAPGDYRFEVVDTPRAGEGEMILKVEACGICAGDVKAFHGAKSFWGGDGNPPYIKAPMIPGHEFVGRVVEIGDKVKGNWKIGDRICPEQIVPCGECMFCKTGSLIVIRDSRFVNEFHILKATCKFCTRLSTFVMTFPFFPLLL